VFGVIRGNKRESKDTWNDNVQKTISEKKQCYKRLHHHMSDENIQKYKKARRNTKKTVSEAKSQVYVKLVKSQVYVKLYRKLDMKDGENNMYKMAKFRERKIRDFN
jgi:putative protein kinase ArgK-like GTPase of G3E family